MCYKFRILHILKLLLLPFSWIYGGIVSLRRALYRLNILKSQQHALPVIVVGNLTVGGTGKTPHTLWLMKNLSTHYECVYLSRGYGRSTNGFRIVTQDEDAQAVGDEAKWISLNSTIPVVVSENRNQAIQEIIQRFPGTELVFMDDGLQHLSLQPRVKVLLTDRNKLFIHDHLLPYGRLREHKRNAQEVDCIIITKCNHNFEIDETSLHELKSYGKPLFYSRYEYLPPRKLFQSDRVEVLPESIILVTGIADSSYLIKHLQKHQIIRHFEFKDHHNFTSEDINTINQLQKEHNAIVITTAKDEVRLKDISNFITDPDEWLVLDIEVVMDRPQELLALIIEKIK